ncbi:LacI family transcriptional regulator [Roseivivax lentus]|uniref:LacI family transcriptional regulator n=2 Tax=Roseivivax lentus TaxID=633194 RepID=A0A1N7NPH7_9RHOB|nr:LacI family transcriptional regulator [Roseivivax lentus]
MFDEIATSPFASISIEGLQEEAWKEGVIVEVVMTGGHPGHETAVLNKWAADGVHGVAYASILTREITPPDALARHNAVLLNCLDATGRYPSIVPAERRGGELATRTLIEAGHKRIAFITGEPWMDASIQRQEGYLRALRDAGLPVDPALIVEGNFLPSGGHAATVALLEAAPDLDAIFCANDLMAIGCYEALKERGHRIGETIAVMGYDDQEVAQHLSPALTTVLLPHREMGQWCARRLLDDGPVGPEKMRLEGPVMLRGSHLAPLRPAARD